MVKKIIVEKQINDEDMKKNIGKFYKNVDYNLIIKEDSDVYHRLEDGNLKLLFCFRKRVIPEKYMRDAVTLFKETAIKTKTNNRGVASGPVDLNKIELSAKQLSDPGKFKTRIVNSDGTESKYKVSNYVNSMIVGYYDKPKREKQYGKMIPCRLTAFTEKNWDKWDTIYPLINVLDRMYKYYLPDHYKAQWTMANVNPNYTINNSVFSTITVNYNWRTACHLDSGDFRDGYSVILVAEEGNYTGGYLGYPQYKVCVDVRNGDFLLKDPHEYHCNTEIKGKNYMRLSMVFYFRENIVKC
jgi:hypothetical protein